LALSYSTTAVYAPPAKYTVTFGQTGLDSSATGTVVTVDGSAKKYANPLFSKEYSEDTKVTYSYEASVSSSVSSQRFRLNSVSGPPSPITVTSDTTVTGNYVKQYYLTVTSSYDTPSGQGWYDAESIAYATLASGTVSGGTGIRYIFTGWSGDASGTGLTSNAITMTGPKTATANWKKQYYLTVISAHGSPSPASGWFDAGASITASVTNSAEGSNETRYGCTGWTGTGSIPVSGTGSTVTFNINSPSDLTWNWKTQYYITVTSAYGNPTPSAWVDAGSSFTASVTSPAEIVPNDYQWVCTGFSVDGGVYQAGTNYTFTNVRAPHRIDFAWKKGQFWIQIISAHGSPTSSKWIDQGGNLTVNVTSPADDNEKGTRYRCVGYKIDDGNLQAGTNYTFTNIQAAHKIEFQWIPQHLVTFTESGPEATRSITLTVNGSAHSGTTVFTYSEWFDKGFSVAFNITKQVDSATAGKRYALLNWRNTTGSILASPQTITGPTNLTAYYQPQYYLTVDTNFGGLSPQPSISPIGPWYDNGTLVACTGQFINGYAFDYWVLDGSNQQADRIQITVVMNSSHIATAHYRSLGAIPSIEGVLQVSAFFAAIAIVAWFGRIRIISKRLWNYAVELMRASARALVRTSHDT
jgi:uncharacterized repeat protein (TIGR02543 family)